MRIVRVIKAHSPDSSSILTMKVGETLQGERRVTEWSGWLWCTNTLGISGWVPEAYLSILPESGKYKAIRNYTSLELSVEIGQEVTILLEEASWGWARTNDGTNGWIPLDSLGIQCNPNNSRVPKEFCSSLLLSSVI